MPLKLNQMLRGDCPSKRKKPGREIELCSTDTSVIVRDWGAIIVPRLPNAANGTVKYSLPFWTAPDPNGRFHSQGISAKHETLHKSAINIAPLNRQTGWYTVFIYRSIVNFY
jgi:hypothetical protein